MRAKVCRSLWLEPFLSAEPWRQCLLTFLLHLIHTHCFIGPEIEPNTGDTSVQLKVAGQMQSTPIH
jgi:hypothetical protein